MSDVVNQANGEEPEAATLTFPGGVADFPIRSAVDGHSSIDLSSLTGGPATPRSTTAS